MEVGAIEGRAVSGAIGMTGEVETVGVVTLPVGVLLVGVRTISVYRSLRVRSLSKTATVWLVRASGENKSCDIIVIWIEFPSILC